MEGFNDKDVSPFKFGAQSQRDYVYDCQNDMSVGKIKSNKVIVRKV